MTQPNPDLTLIRTALTMSRTLARQANGTLRHFYDCQTDALAALDRIEKKIESPVFLATPSTPLTEADVQAATCSV